MIQEITEIKKTLKTFIGTDAYHQTVLPNVNCTDGVHYVRSACDAFWLVDAIASYQPEFREKAGFQVWTLKVNDERKGVLTMKEDSDKPDIIKQEFDYTDFPLDKMEMWCIDGIILLPSEY